MQLHELVAEVFGDGGALAQADASFKPRAGQQQMAQAVAQTLEQGGALVVEAGTGVGKTFAYLVPALLSGERVLVSTATKALQDQIFARDLPLLRKALGISLHAALLKGRASYLCPYRLELAESEMAEQEPARARQIEKIRHWAASTQTGDLSEMPGFQERSPVLPLVTSTRENCLGSQCPQFTGCFVNKARKEALAADLVVINHHLFFADMQVRESGMAELLPSVRAVIVDEAHQFNDTGVQFMGQQLGSGQLVDFARDLLKTATRVARGMAQWQNLAHALDAAAKDWRALVAHLPNGARMNWLGAAPQDLTEDAWRQALTAVDASLCAIEDALAKVEDAEPELKRMMERCILLRQRCLLFMLTPAPGLVRWLEAGLQVKVFESPLDIADTMRSRWGITAPVQGGGPPQEASEAAAEADQGSARAWIFTSATLGMDDRLSLFTQTCGLEAARVLQVPSPFNYPEQAGLYVPQPFPRPNEPSHSRAVAAFSQKAIEKLGGRTLVLTTTLKALKEIGEQLRQSLMHRDDIEVLMQGEASKQQLMQRFRQGSSQGDAGCVLVASATFWEGFDAPGDALQLVIIDKLPFAPPNDPLMQARSRRVEERGGRAFQEIFVPEAAVALKQGTGRLIRRETDRGLLVICDTRLLQMGYGKQLLASLPPMRVLRAQEEFEAALAVLAAPAGKDMGMAR